MSKESLHVSPGRPLPLGTEELPEGFNFSVFSRHAERIELLLFDAVTASEPALIVDLGRPHHRTGDIWHALVEGARCGQAYVYRVHGPWTPECGLRFDGTALLLDPVAYAVSGAPFRRSVLIDRRFDWQGTTRPRTPWPDTVLYETHVRGLTIDPSANSAYPGTFLSVNPVLSTDIFLYERRLGMVWGRWPAGGVGRRQPRLWRAGAATPCRPVASSGGLTVPPVQRRRNANRVSSSGDERRLARVFRYRQSDAQ